MSAIWRHFKTICRHKAIVLRECRACGITWQGIIHDMSKFGLTEFVSSAKYFQGNRSPIEAEKEAIGYSNAWLHHKGHNKHHWEYWCDYHDDGSVFPHKIPFKYVVEMICDWISAGIVYGGGKWNKEEPMKYYLHVRKGRHFDPQTEALIIKFLTTIYENDLEEFHKMARCEGDYAYLAIDYEKPGTCP